MSRHSSFSRILSFLLSLILILTLTEPAAHAEGFSDGQLPDLVVTDDPVFTEEEDLEGLIDDQEEDCDIAAEEGITLSPEVIAQEIAEPVPSPYDGEVTEVSDATIVAELPEKRDIDTIQFRLNDGSLTAAIYSYPVHEKDSSGEWQEIDNRLSLKEGPDGLSYYGRESLHEPPLDGPFAQHLLVTDRRRRLQPPVQRLRHADRDQGGKPEPGQLYLRIV